MDNNKIVFCKINNKNLRTVLTNMGYVLDQNWDEEYLDMGTGIVLTPENRFYVTVKETEPDINDTYYCYDNEEMFDFFARYYHWNNLSETQKNDWCGYCGCEGGCNLCINLNLFYNKLLVEYNY